MKYGDYEIHKVGSAAYEIPPQGGMRVPGRVYATEKLFDLLCRDNALQQVINVAHLPGIIGYSLAMPDIHWGYGFPIGGVAAFDLDKGVISPGGVGYDINCGVRLMSSTLSREDVAPHIRRLVEAIYRLVPSGVGTGGPLKVGAHKLNQVFSDGARWAVREGYGSQRDLAHIEEGGCIAGADPHEVSDRARKRGSGQLGTLGSGNHFVEIGYVDRVYLPNAAKRMGLADGTVTVIVHTGSRGCGHQICTDTLKVLQKASRHYGIELPDRQLAAAPIGSPEGQAYLKAMRCAVNYAFANRQVIGQRIREAFRETLGGKDHKLEVVYEVAHNIAKIEKHNVDGKPRKVCVHRKGATRAFGPSRTEIPDDYREIGQPVLIPGDMGRYSYVLVGTDAALDETWGSTCHGAGRQQSRKQAKRKAKGRNLMRELEETGVYVRASSMATVAEEMPEAYKDVASVVEAVEQAGISKIVARLRPLGCVKG
ncbi:RtcB family protein [Planctomycetota bacterium]